MSKIVLNDVTNLNALSVINDNFDKLEQELQNKVLYRDNPEGEPNTLENDIDANGNSLYNVQDLTITGGFTVDGEDVGAYIGQAAIAAADAEASATAAANSATAAGLSASSANADANSADEDATAAAASAASATSSAATATTQAGIATTQAGIATTGATTATTKASEASTSASNAATSETNAASSESSAATSATNSASSASSAAASAAAVAAALDNFDDRYLGSKSVAPILDNDGNALVEGALYYNDGTIISDDKGMWVYDSSVWIKTTSASQAILIEYKYLATSGQTVFTGADANALTLAYTPGSIIVTLNGSKLLPQDYTATSGTSITLAVAASLNDELNIVAFSTFDIANTYTQAQTDALLANKLATSAGAVGTSNLASDAVTADKIAAGAVGTSEIADANVTPDKLSQKLTLGTVVSASGAAIDFTSIPSWVKRVTVMLDRVSTSGTSTLIIQLGTSGGVETSSYVGLCAGDRGNEAQMSSGFLLWVSGAGPSATSLFTGAVCINNITSNTFISAGSVVDTNSGGSSRLFTNNGVKALSGTLDRVRITTTNGTDTFDAGSVNILYEG